MNILETCYSLARQGCADETARALLTEREKNAAAVVCGNPSFSPPIINETRLNNDLLRLYGDASYTFSGETAERYYAEALAALNADSGITGQTRAVNSILRAQELDPNDPRVRLLAAVLMSESR